MTEPAPAAGALDAELRTLIDEYRTRCLWFLRPDFYPATRDEALRTLRHIETHADRDGFVRAARLRQWLSPPSSAPSAGGAVRLEWTQDSAYRFFPLVRHPDLGLTLHPFDLATNKLLALVGRREVRDWVDVIECDRRLQPLGYLAWAACGKDPGFSPAGILEHAARANRYTADEVAELAFDGAPPDAAELSRCWHAALDTARRTVDLLPAQEAGTCVLHGDDLCRLPPEELAGSLAALRFRTGSLRGVLPAVRPS